MAKQAVQSPPTDLMHAFDFTPEDLDANRDNYMSKRQRSRLYRRRILREYLAACLFVPLFLIVLGTSIWLEALFASGNRPFSGMPLDPSWWMLLLLSWATAPIFVATVYFYGRRKTKQDLYKGFIRSVCGRLYVEDLNRSFHGDRQGGSYGVLKLSYAFEINDVHFIASQHQWEMLLDKEGRQLCVYYAPNSKIILSIEEMA